MSLGTVPVLGFVPPPPPLLPAPVVVPGLNPTAPGGIPLLPDRSLEDALAPFGFVPETAPTFQPAGVPLLPLPNQFPRDAIAPGPLTVEEIPAQFTGGQCGSKYFVTGQLRAGGTPLGVRTARMIGPIGGGSLRNSGSNWWIEVTNNGRFGGIGSNCGAVQTTNPETAQFAAISTNADEVEVMSFSVSPCGDEPDNCGDPPPIQQGERRPNPARSFVPSPQFVPQTLPSLPPLPFPTISPGIAPEPGPDDQPRRVPGLPFLPVPPGELVPIAPSTIPGLPTFPTLPPSLVPPTFPTLPPSLVPPGFPALPPGTPTRQPVPPVIAAPPLVRIPPPVNLDCCAIPEVIRQGQAIRRKLDEFEFPDQCVDLCEPATMLEVVCEGGLGLPITTTSEAVTVLDLSSGLGRLSRQVAEIAEYLNICAPKSQGGGGCPPPGDVGLPMGAVATGLSGEASGQLEPGLVLTGLKIEFVSVPPGANQYAPGVYRGVGYFYMGTPQGLDQDYAGSMIRDGQFIFAEQCNLTVWLVSVNSGYNVLVTPYARIYSS